MPPYHRSGLFDPTACNMNEIKREHRNVAPSVQRCTVKQGFQT